MVKATAAYVKGVGWRPIDSPLEVVMREKNSFTEGLGWSYRFKSGLEWVLVPLEEVTVFVYDEKPEASTVSGRT